MKWDKNKVPNSFNLPSAPNVIPHDPKYGILRGPLISNHVIMAGELISINMVAANTEDYIKLAESGMVEQLTSQGVKVVMVKDELPNGVLVIGALAEALMSFKKSNK